MKISKIILFSVLLLVGNLWAAAPAWQQISGTQYSMVVIASGTINDADFTGEGANIFGAFGPGGQEDCRGLGMWDEAGYWYFTIVSDNNGEDISFLMYNSANDEIVECNKIVNFSDNVVIGTPSSPFQITSGLANGTINGQISIINTHSVPANITDVTIYANGTSTHPDENGNYSLSVPPGTYTISAVLKNYYSNVSSTILVSNGQTTENVNFSLIDWNVMAGNQYSFTVMANLQIGGKIIPNNSQNFLGAFGPGGYEDCRAIATWEPANLPYWEGYWFFTIVGDTNGEEIKFSYFDAKENVCVETVSFLNNAVYGEPTSPFTLTAGFIEQTINLNSNWNWVSFYVQPEDPAISTLFSSINSNIYQIKNQNSSSTYYPSLNSWVGDLEKISVGDAYLIKMLQPDQMTISGEAIALNTPIALAENWNWIAYFSQDNMNLNNALSSVLPNVLQIKDQDETAFYYNPPGSWVGNLEYMTQGNGYKINMNAADNLTYSNESRITPKANNKKFREVPDWKVISGTQYSMVMIVQVQINEEQFENLGNNSVGVFGSGGEDDCHGIGVWQKVGDYGFWYITVVGNEIDEKLSIKIYNEADDTIYTNNEVIIFKDNTTIGDIETPHQSAISQANTTEENPILSKLEIYPNPFYPSNIGRAGGVTIQFSNKQSEQMDIEIYNIKGQKVKTLISDLLPADQHSIVWDGKDANNKLVSSGLYFVKLQSEKHTIATQKFMLLK